MSGESGALAVDSQIHVEAAGFLTHLAVDVEVELIAALLGKDVIFAGLMDGLMTAETVNHRLASVARLNAGSPVKAPVDKLML